MGERLKPFDNEPTAEVEKSLALEEKTFSILSQSEEGLSCIESQDDLIEFAFNRKDLSDIVYIFKFIYDENIFFQIACDEASSFQNLNKEEKEEVSKLANIFFEYLTKPPYIHEAHPVKTDGIVEFIAFLHKKEEQLEIALKPSSVKDVHLFQSLLSKINSKSDDYPDLLRSTGDINISISDDKKSLEIIITGNASNSVYQYAPGFLKKFDFELKEFFKSKFNVEEVTITY